MPMDYKKEELSKLRFDSRIFAECVLDHICDYGGINLYEWYILLCSMKYDTSLFDEADKHKFVYSTFKVFTDEELEKMFIVKHRDGYGIEMRA